MRVLSSAELKQRCENLADVDDALVAEYEGIVRRYDEIGPKMDDTADLMFSNHVMCLLKRIRTGEYVPEMDEELFAEVSENARTLALDLLKDAFAKAGQEPNATEVLMLATHLDVAIGTNEKGMSNE